MARELLLRNVRRPGTDAVHDVVVRDGRVRAVVPAGTVRLAVPGRELDAGGRVIVPGLVDAHVHLTQWALHRRHLDVADARSGREVAAAVAGALPDHRRAAAADAAPQVLQAVRMRMSLFDHPPHRDDLDAIAGDTPVAVVNIDLHTVWCNGRLLDALGISSDDGLLREAAGYAVLERLAQVPLHVQDRLVGDALQHAATQGVTGVKDFEFTDAVAQWQRRAAASRPALRIDTTVYAPSLDAAIERGLPTGAIVPGSHGMVRAGHLKLFVDGSLNSSTAWCHEPATGPATGESGHRVMAPDELRALVARAWAHGIQPSIHAIGDRAVTTALDVIEEVRCPGRIEHVQLVRDEDLPRFARADLVASVQPAHLIDDRDVTDRLWADRAERAYRFGDLQAAGARLVFGSDAPVSPLDPWAGVVAAVARTLDDRPPWHATQALDRRTALTAACGGRAGLSVGEVADLAVLDDDPLQASPGVVRALSSWLTVVDGRVVHGPEPA